MNVRGPLAPALSAAMALSVALALAVLSGCSLDSAAGERTDGKVNVIASFYPLKFITERIGGEHVIVHSLTRDGVEPHDLELTPRQTGELGEAGLVVYLKGLQPAVDEAVAQAAPRHVVEASALSPLKKHGNGVDGTRLASPGTEQAGGQDAQRGPDSSLGDPHIWLDPTRLAKVAGGVEKELASVDPANADAFRANADALVDDLDALDQEFTTGLAHVRNRAFLTTHAAFGYLAERYRLHEYGISGIDPESEPSPARLAELHDIVHQQRLNTIFFETLVSTKTARTLARDLSVKTAVLDPIEGIKDPDQDDYFSVMRRNLNNLRIALGSS